MRAPVIHYLKTRAKHFNAVCDGTKTFELRLDDRSPRFEPGDVIVLQEFNRDGATGRIEARPIVGVLRAEELSGPLVRAIAPGFAILSLGSHAECISEHVE